MSQVVDTSKVSEVIEDFKRVSSRAISCDDPAAFEQAEAQLTEIEGYVRELEQAMWADEATLTLDHLENGDALTATDRAVIRTFLVSDAAHYLNQERDFDDWVAELNRLISAMQSESDPVTRENIGELRGMLRDAMRLFPDMRHYVEERNRLARFDCAVEEPDAATRRTLAKIIREQLCSPTR